MVLVSLVGAAWGFKFANAGFVAAFKSEILGPAAPSSWLSLCTPHSIVDLLPSFLARSLSLDSKSAQASSEGSDINSSPSC